MTDRTLFIYYGSQTGTAEGFAKDLGSDAALRGVRARICDLDDFNADVFASHRAAVIVISNTGDGDPPDNSLGFHSWMTGGSAVGSSFLSGLSYAVFGLGDRTYASFNAMGEVTDSVIGRFGAQRLCKRGIGDASDDIVRDFQDWAANDFWPALLAAMPQLVSENGVDAGEESGVPQQPDPVFCMAQTVAGLPPEATGQPADVLARFYFQAEKAKVSKVQQLRQAPSLDDGLSTMQVDLACGSCPGVRAGYASGATLELLPENSAQEVAAMLPLLGISEAAKPGDIGDLDCCITFSPPAGVNGTYELKRPFPTPCQLRDALTRYCDLRRAPSRQMLRALQSSFEPDVKARIGKLLADPAAFRLVSDEALGISQFEFWTGIGAERLDLGKFLLHCPRQRPRNFTVASSPAALPEEVQICASLVSHEAFDLEEAVTWLQQRGVFAPGCQLPPREERWYGLCSHWLCTRLKPGTLVLAKCKASAFKLPAEDVPLVMVGAGAGVAPFRGFWQDLQAKAEETGKARSAHSVLYFGCRHAEHDWIYRSDMTLAAKSRSHSAAAVFDDLVVAFSRLGEDDAYDKTGCCGEYVQDKLRAQVEDLRQWLSSGGVVIVCGASRMSQAVLSVVESALPGGAEELKTLRSSGRVIVESWGEPHKPPKLEELLTEGGGGGYNGEAAAPEVAITALSKELLEVVKTGNRLKVEELLSKGADANYQAGSRKYTRIGLRQEVGETGLHWAALRGDQAIAELLLNAKADPDLKDQDGKSALHIAAFNGVMNVSQQLLQAKCDANAQDLRGNTALHWVLLAGGSMRMIRLLLKSGARGDIANAEGELPADMAEDQGSDAAANIIRQAVEAAS
eukprot:TRINITY_DN25971_c0_g1_i1.p1 TRINITY_DN25971_c0_g1~~TRINITY_DN25971_c0_g1_i1.p1  ORF type:complete len:887 (-),score=234.91 TRINITY_DN25971_c0_g1_i1:225-2786(-)